MKKRKHYLKVNGRFDFSWAAAAVATLLSLWSLNFRIYASRRMKRSSTLLHFSNFLLEPNIVTHLKYLSFVIISKPCTISPLVIWGPMPLKRLSSPSCSAIWRRTSMKLLKGLPCRLGGGFDCRQTLATIMGCVAIVARAFERAPRTKVC